MRNKMGLSEIKDMFNLEGKTAVITGGSGGFGKAAAIGLAAYGADVVVTSRTLSSLEKTVSEIKDQGKEALAVSCDVTNEESVSSMAGEVIDKFGKIDIMVTGAGIAARHPAEEMPMDEFQKVMDANVKGTLLCCREAGKDMIKRGEPGSIITVGSIRGFLGHPAGYSAYGTSKGAVHLLTKQLACEWAKYKIRVNCIAPCIFWTPLTEPILNDKEMYKIFMSRIPIGRAAEPEDFISSLLFLASSGSGMVTGHILSVDGGAAAG